MVMGTKVQHAGYLQNFHTMGDLKDDANGCWSQYFDHQSLGKSMNKENKLMPTGCLNYDRELFRRTILEHEAVFRKQVYELHRLHRKQKEMMDELKKMSCKPLQTRTSDSHILSSNTNILDSKNIRLKRNTLGLELPAKTYIDCNEKETTKEIIVEPSLVALNEPVKEICFGEVFVPVSSKFVDSNAESKDILYTAKSCVMKDYSKSLRYDEGTSSNKLHLHVENKTTNREWSSLNNEAGQSSDNKKPSSSSSYVERYPVPLANLNPNKIYLRIPPLDQSKIDSWFRPNLENIGKKPDNGHIVNPLLNSQLGVERCTQFSAYGKFSDTWHSQTRVKNDPTSYLNSFNSGQNGYTDVRLNHTLLNGFLNGSKTQKINKPGESINSFDFQHLASSSQVESTIVQNKEASEMQNNKKIFGFCISETVHAKCEDKIEANHPKLQNHIDLNIDLNSSMSFDDDDDDDKIPQSPIPIQENQDEDRIKEAIENILLISSHKSCHSIDSSSSTLLWFADVVSSSNTNNSKEETSVVSLDSFELMTLELEEIKPDKDLFHPFKTNFQNDKDSTGKDIDSLVFDKPKRGQGRQRRQRRDFQSDILPSIASLSRKEVSEDIQTIAGLMKAVGKCWEGRNGNSRGRVGRRPKIDVSPLLLPEKNKESNVIGFGWTTRRCRRQRVPPVSNGAAPLT